MNIPHPSLLLVFRCLILTMSSILVVGCATLLNPQSATENDQVRVLPLFDPDKSLLKKKLFFAEYLQKSARVSKRIAVLLEVPETPLAVLMDPRKYQPSQSGSASLEDIMKRYTPLQLHILQAPAGKLLGYALLHSKQKLRTVRITQGRYWLQAME